MRLSASGRCKLPADVACRFLACGLHPDFSATPVENGTDSDTESSEPDSGSKRTDVQLWSDLPRDFRRKFGIAGGALPAVEVLAFLVDSEQEARAWCDLSKK